ncbi:MAG: hypothetical protein WAM04_06075 [Candidatus Sulfotelmatobacter sp.]
MDRPERTNTQPFEFSQHLLHRLNLYALGAAAAGVGMLASTTPSEAKVVYTPAHVVIPGGGYLLDLNHDGINDFNLNLNGTTNGHSNSLFLSARPMVSQNLIWGQDEVKFGLHPRVAAFDLPPGVQIGPNNEQPTGTKLLAGYYFFGTTGGLGGHGTGGDWAKGVSDRYLGFAFSINGETHLGWARLNVTMTASHSVRALLTGYAYETVANKPIVTGKTSDQPEIPQALLAPNTVDQPQTASLGALALGSSGLSIWRREV